MQAWGLSCTCIMTNTTKLQQAWIIFKLPIKPQNWMINVIIQCIFFFLSIGWEPTTWPANNCLQIMVCSRVVAFKCVCCKYHALERKMADQLPRAAKKWLKYENKLGDRMIKQLLNSVIAKYHDLSVSRRSIICLSLWLQQIIDLLASDKSQYFAQPHPIINNYSLKLR